MTIDERLEALTQTVELMAHMQIETEKKFGAAIAAIAEAQAMTDRAQAKTERTVNRLGRYAMLIPRDREARLAALELDESDLAE